jgi:quercetin dioxygenase-like cupin family protein
MTEQYPARPESGFVVAPDEGRTLPVFGQVKISGRDTGGSFEVIEFRGNTASPPPHIHREREECIHVLDGRFTFTIGHDARALILVVPAGLEGFFAELGGALAAGTPTHEVRAALKGRFDSIPA